VYLGEDGERLAAACGSLEKVAALSMSDAVAKATSLAESGDIVLLSPACASFDMFSGFPARGDAFVDAVDSL
jgi:UDP-N-acetylmuramoylalanine--D-glutamate ligase